MKAIIDAIKAKDNLDLAGVQVLYLPAISNTVRSRIEHAKVYVDGVHVMTYTYPLYSVCRTTIAPDTSFVNNIVNDCKASLEWKAVIDIEECRIKDVPMRHHLLGLSYTASGYGKKLPTRYKVYFKGIWRRVYSTCFSNVSSEYIVLNGENIKVEL